MPCLTENYDIVVVGAGHAGCEAALAAARLGFATIIFTVSVDSIALMPCNAGEAIEALVSLGYLERDVADIVESLDDGKRDVSELIKVSLIELGKGR